MILLRRSLVGAALVAALVAGVAGTALSGTANADTTPTPDTASASPTDTSSAPTDGSTPAPQTATDAVPSPSGSAAPDHGTRTPAAFPVDRTPTMTTSPSTPAPEPSLSDAPPSDGVGLGAGQADQYLSLAATRETAAAANSTAQQALAAAHATVVSLQTRWASLAISSALARDEVTSSQASTDDVAAQMYQQGDGGLGAIGTILTGGPDGFLSNLSTVTMMNEAANGVVRQTESARERLALADVQRWTLEDRLAAARTAEQDAAAAAARTAGALAALDAQLAALDIAPPQVAVGPDGCPTQDVPDTLRGGAQTVGAATLCRKAVAQAATPQAALAITWAFQHLGAAYACGGAGRLLPFRADCSSFVSRAYYEGAGLATAGPGWAPSTRDMVPWDGAALDPHYVYVAPAALRPGDLVLYDTCPQGGCGYKHVVMYLGSPDGGRTSWMVHTNACGDVAKVEPFWGFPSTNHPFLVARRVVALPGELVVVPLRTHPASAATTRGPVGPASTPARAIAGPTAALRGGAQ